MPAYNFKKRFAPLVESGVKRQTLRFPRKRPTVVGDTLHLYTGMRTKQCRRLLPPTPCTAVTQVLVLPDAVVIGDTKHLATSQEAHQFAQADGFGDYPQLVKFLQETYPLTRLLMEMICW